jgi:hypothetical protein
MDLFVVLTIGFGLLYAFVIVRLDLSRRSDRFVSSGSMSGGRNLLTRKRARRPTIIR